MRGMTSGGRRYYRDVTHVHHIGNCVQKTVRADEAEQQVVDLICAVKLPADWQEWVMNNHFTPQESGGGAPGDTGGIRAGAAGAAGSGDRVVSGRGDQQGEVPGREVARRRRQTDRAGCVQRRWMLGAAVLGIIEAGHVLEGFAQRWAAAQTPLAKNELLRLILAGAQIKGHSLTALVVELAFYPLMRHCPSVGEPGVPDECGSMNAGCAIPAGHAHPPQPPAQSLGRGVLAHGRRAGNQAVTESGLRIGEARSPPVGRDGDDAINGRACFRCRWSLGEAKNRVRQRAG